jgi:hypothetical protein
MNHLCGYENVVEITLLCHGRTGMVPIVFKKYRVDPQILRVLAMQIEVCLPGLQFIVDPKLEYAVL